MYVLYFVFVSGNSKQKNNKKHYTLNFGKTLCVLEMLVELFASGNSNRNYRNFCYVFMGIYLEIDLRSPSGGHGSGYCGGRCTII